MSQNRDMGHPFSQELTQDLGHPPLGMLLANRLISAQGWR